MSLRIAAITILLLTDLTLMAQIQIGSTPRISYSQPREYEIGGVTVEGTENLDEGAIRLLSGLAVGDRIEVPSDKTSQAVKQLWKQDLFSDVQLLVDRIEGNKIFFIIRIKERSRLSRFRFEGVKKSEADDIREKINLYKEKIVTENLVMLTHEKVYEYYNDKGYGAARIDIDMAPDSLFKRHVIMTIRVDKGRKVRIKRILPHGNEFFNDYELRRKLKETKEKTYFRPFIDLDTLGKRLWLDLRTDRKQIPASVFRYGSDHMRLRVFKSSKYLEKNLEDDLNKVEIKYQQKGFRDARVISDTVYPSGENTVNVEFTTHEGHPYYFRNIKWIGNTKYSSDELSSRLNIKPGDIYNPSKLDSRLYMDPAGTDVTSLYMDNGYLFFQLDPVEILVGDDSIDLEIRIYEGEQARIRRVTISGNTKTNDHVILRSLYTVPGQLFSRADIIRSQRELTILGFFDQEQMNVIPTPDPATGTVDIEFVVTEKPNDQLMLQGGYGAQMLVATVGIQFNNFSTRNILKPKQWNGPLPTGDGQKLGLNINSNGRTYQAANISFTEPWLGGSKPITFTMSGFYSNLTDGGRKFNETPSGKILRTNRSFFERVGVSTQLGRQLTWPDNYWSLVIEASAQQYTLQNNSQLFFLNTGQAYNLFLKFRLGRNSMNDNIFPTYGSDMGLSCQFTPPYSYFNNIDYGTATLRDRFRFLEYHKWKFSWAYYTPLAGSKRKLVLYTKVGFGALGLYNRRVGMVPFERFYLGGDMFSLGLNNLDSRDPIGLRGYDGNGVSPVHGATLINKYTMELRYPLSTNPSATIYTLAFAEAGNSWNRFGGFNPLDVYKSTGLGVRIFLPMFGLLGVDWAYRLDDTDYRPEFPMGVNAQRFRFHFTLGFQFGEL